MAFHHLVLVQVGLAAHAVPALVIFIIIIIILILIIIIIIIIIVIVTIHDNNTILIIVIIIINDSTFKQIKRSLVVLLVDVALVQAPLPHLADDLLVLRQRRAGEVLVLDAEHGPEVLELLGHLVDHDLRRLALPLGGLRDLLAVLVHAGDEVDVRLLHRGVPGHDVRGDGRVRAADVRRAVGVEERRRQRQTRQGAVLYLYIYRERER